MSYPPSWYTPAKAQQVLNLRVARGLHPTGRPLGPEASTCGACVHLHRRDGAGRRVYLKCEQDRRFWNAGLATDLRASWRGCERFEEVSRAE
jgi:hypothetical protein